MNNNNHHSSNPLTHHNEKIPIVPPVTISLKLKPPPVLNPTNSSNSTSLPPPTQHERKKIKLSIGEIPEFYSCAQAIMIELKKHSFTNESPELPLIQSKMDSKEYKTIQEFMSDVESKVVDGIQDSSLRQSISDHLRSKAQSSSVFKPQDMEQLFLSIESQDYKTAEKILKRFPSLVNHLAPCKKFGAIYTWSPLHAASYFGLDRLVRVLMDLGAQVELQDTLNKARALGWAAYGGHSHICKLLVNEYKADPWALNKHGQTAFALVADPANPKWAGVWSNRPDQENTGGQESVSVKMVLSKTEKTTSKVLIKVPTLKKDSLELMEEDDDEEDDEMEPLPSTPIQQFTNISHPTTVHGSTSVNANTNARQFSKKIIPSFTTPAPQPPRPIVNNIFSTSYGQPNVIKCGLIKNLVVSSNNSSFKTSSYTIDPDYYGLAIHVPFIVSHLRLSLHMDPSACDDIFLHPIAFTWTSKLEMVNVALKSWMQYESNVSLKEGLNLFEYRVAGGVIDESPLAKTRPFTEFIPGTEKGQVFLLTVIRS